MKSCFVFLFTLLVGVSGSATFLPAEILDAAPRATAPSNISAEEFKRILSTLQSTYAPLASEQGGRLSISGNWNDEKLNAGATQIFGNWAVQITGGLARRPELTPDGFALIVCHEVGHHLAGFAFAPADSPFSGRWAANEGQADYFSTQVCAKKLWAAERDQNQKFRELVTLPAQAGCDHVYALQSDRDLCYRISVAIESMTTTMAVLMKKPAPKFETPDPKSVEQTSHAHPAVQCRMDTVFQGSLCTAPFNDHLIPGKKASGGVDSIAAEQEAAQTSCMASGSYEIGLRPTCWFKPRL